MRGTGDEDTADDAVTMYIGYAKTTRAGSTAMCGSTTSSWRTWRTTRRGVCRSVPTAAGYAPPPGRSSRTGRPWRETAETRKQIAGRALALQLAQEVAAGIGGEAWKPWRRRWQQSRRRLRQNGTTADHAHGAGARTGPPKEQEYEEVILPITNSSRPDDSGPASGDRRERPVRSCGLPGSLSPAGRVPGGAAEERERLWPTAGKQRRGRD